ncbi:TRAP transporter permease [Halospeciosus flavus]|uniref:TRAP transporter permease n=1 Tax=Halospeciosus flavus TaxID=3032283 RepID=A0ABD5Z6Z0_9EURY|nr:TRAP transporter fused permease subunit [Halospeciosus flavus]
MTDTTRDRNRPTTSPRAAFDSLEARSPTEQVLVALVTVIGIALTASTLYFAWERPMVRSRWGIIFLGAGMTLYYLDRTLAKLGEPDSEGGSGFFVGRLDDRQYAMARRLDAVLCLVSAVAAAGASAYVQVNFERLFTEAIVVGFRQPDVVAGLVVVALVTDATRRAYGWSISLVVVGSVAYALFGTALPGFLSHTGMTLRDVATYGAVRISGAYGFILEIGATWVAIFIMFAGLARVYGALDVILDLGERVSQNLRSGVVHMAVISSMAMGSITGSAAANTATTGSFTIPMMKRQGVRADFAAAIESVASSGGQIMPPVMGVAAFLMADILGVSYVRIIQAAIIPALLFYFSVGVAVQFAVLRYGWTTEKTESAGFLRAAFSLETLVTTGYAVLLGAAFYAARDVLGLSLIWGGLLAAGVVLTVRFGHALVVEPSPTDARDAVGTSLERFFTGGHFAIPMLVLVYTLVVMRLSPLAAGLYTTVTMIATMYVRDLFVDGATPSTPVGTTVKTLEGFKQGALDMAPLVGVLASMGVIISMLTQTGLTQKVSLRMVALGGGVLVFVLLLAMCSSILFGLGMPTPAAYILVQALVAPALVGLGVADITAHLFVFYFAMLSAITPPVAVGVAVGSRIADSGFLTSAIQALRIGAAGFLIPFALVANDSLVTWTVTETPVATAAVLVGVVSLTAATIGYDGRHVLGYPRRVVYLALSLLAMYAPALGGIVGSSGAMGLQLGAAALALLGLGLAHVGRLPRPLAPPVKPEE